MSGRHYFSVVALLASTALSTVPFASAQGAEEAGTETTSEDDLVQQTVVVRGAFIPDEKRSTSEVSSLLDAEDFAIQGDGDVASALRRVTGVSIADGKFVIVRGLNERYSSSTLNGSPLPSPEPLRRVAPLDLFPTSVLDSTLVQKTYSPELSAEFGGGSIDIRTKAVPDERFLDIGFSAGGDTETSFQDGLLYDGSDTDYLTFDDGARDLPAGLSAIFANGTFDDGSVVDSSQNRTFGRALLTDASLLVQQEGYVGPDLGISLTAGERIDVNEDLSIGLLLSGAYDNEYTSRVAERGFGFIQSGDNLSPSTDFESRFTTNTSSVNLLAGLGFDIYDDHELQFNAFVTRSSEKETRSDEGFLRDGIDFNERRDVIEWVERELWTTQARGEHVFPYLLDLEFNWRASYSEATREAPYQFSVGYNLSSGTPEISTEATLTSLEFSSIEDDSTDLGLDFVLPTMFGDREIEFKAGYAYVEKDRAAQNNLLTLSGSTVLGDFETLRPDVAFAQIFNPFTGSGELTEQGSGGLPGFYVATLEVDAFYAGIDAEITPFLRAAIGARYEDAIQAVQTRTFPNGTFEGEDGSFQNPDRVNGPPIEEEEFYPAATLTWNFADNLQLRVGYSETITRPQFREFAPSRFLNTATDQTFFGNPFLVNTELTNYDARLEYYFSRGEFVTFGLFYKELENPIEEVNSGDESGTTTFINVPEATVQGVEFEYQQEVPLRDWMDAGWLASKIFTLKTNYTYTDSEVSANGTVLFFDRASQAGELNSIERSAAGFIEDGRQLQGQSEHLLNFQFGFEDDEARSEANFLINFASERIRAGEQLGSPAAPAVFEKPPVSVDFVYNREFDVYGGLYEFGLTVQNIFGDNYEAFQKAGNGDFTVDTYDIGTSVGVSLKRKF